MKQISTLVIVAAALFLAAGMIDHRNFYLCTDSEDVYAVRLAAKIAPDSYDTRSPEDINRAQIEVDCLRKYAHGVEDRCLRACLEHQVDLYQRGISDTIKELDAAARLKSKTPPLPDCTKDVGRYK